MCANCRHLDFLNAAADLARRQWTQFNLPLMLSGLALLAGTAALQAHLAWQGLGLPLHWGSLCSLDACTALAALLHAAGLYSTSFLLAEGSMVCFLVASLAVVLTWNAARQARSQQRAGSLAPGPAAAASTAAMAQQGNAVEACAGKAANELAALKRCSNSIDVPSNQLPPGQSRSSAVSLEASCHLHAAQHNSKQSASSLVASAETQGCMEPCPNPDCQSCAELLRLLASGTGLLACNLLLARHGLVERNGHDAMHRAAAAVERGLSVGAQPLESGGAGSALADQASAASKLAAAGAALVNKPVLSLVALLVTLLRPGSLSGMASLAGRAIQARWTRRQQPSGCHALHLQPPTSSPPVARQQGQPSKYGSHHAGHADGGRLSLLMSSSCLTAAGATTAVLWACQRTPCLSPVLDSSLWQLLCLADWPVTCLPIPETKLVRLPLRLLLPRCALAASVAAAGTILFVQRLARLAQVKPATGPAEHPRRLAEDYDAQQLSCPDGQGSRTAYRHLAAAVLLPTLLASGPDAAFAALLGCMEVCCLVQLLRSCQRRPGSASHPQACQLQLHPETCLSSPLACSCIDCALQADHAKPKAPSAQQHTATAGVMLALLSMQLFFCTSHFCELAGLQYSAGECHMLCSCDVRTLPCSLTVWSCCAGFVGIDEFSFYASGAWLALNTFAAQLGLALAVPLVATGLSWGQRHATPAQTLLRGLSLTCTTVRTVNAFAAMSSAALQRRHLMVWALFAPKVLFETCFDLAHLAFLILALTLHASVEKTP